LKSFKISYIIIAETTIIFSNCYWKENYNLTVIYRLLKFG